MLWIRKLCTRNFFMQSVKDRALLICHEFFRLTINDLCISISQFTSLTLGLFWCLKVASCFLNNASFSSNTGGIVKGEFYLLMDLYYLKFPGSLLEKWLFSLSFLFVWVKAYLEQIHHRINMEFIWKIN